MAYDPQGDQILLFGGGLATNPRGGAPTWLYDCADNEWRRPSWQVEPPLRCNAALVYEPVSRTMVLFGGYDQSAALNDTWVFDCQHRALGRRRPSGAAADVRPAAARAAGGGKVLVCGYDARSVQAAPRSRPLRPARRPGSTT